MGGGAVSAHLLIVAVCLLAMFVQPARQQMPTTTPRSTGKCTVQWHCRIVEVQ